MILDCLLKQKVGLLQPHLPHTVRVLSSGFEPEIYGLEVRCIIQLCYERIDFVRIN